MFGLTMLPHLLSLKYVQSSFSIGQIVDKVTVTKIEQFGLQVTFGGQHGFVHISRLSDERAETIEADG